MNDTPPLAPALPPPPLHDQRLRIGPIVRDVAVLCVLTAFVGFMTDSLIAAAISNLILAIIGFTISGCLASPRRWRHLSWVAFGVWLVHFKNVLFFDFSIRQWVGGGLIIAVMMCVGGGLSYVFKRNHHPSA
jgi:hypothetical protein